jgi:membrane protease subunit HflK
VQYRVADPYLYLFRVRNVTGTFRAMNEAVMRQVVGDRTVTEVLTVGRQAIETRAEELLRELTQQYEMGITIEQVVLQDVNPPNLVKPSWDEVNQAQQQRDRMINEARAEYNKVIPRARGEAQQAVLEAEGYGLNRVNRAEGESSRFQSIQEAYRKAPDVTRRRLYLETMERVVPRMGGKLYLDPKVRGIVPLLPLDGLKAAVTPPPAPVSPQPAANAGGTR